ncbi:MAG: glutamate--tRNA ligase [Acidimicrobiia bacterium]|nr:glutamate--tRNA ligase [Acidimicrobiia bacterium]MYB11271.1 glutamate--tRNA ligase [Acidimicrobiia bacterium]MYE73737.1 glutamate--tRNA ligase [Acidimicrobiia bacterium]MYG57272.1 glutamate--tRNA ligase [Acidimicrobiia bacterium]MYJ32340.1 glutamate--tRNA ligase [Acidimicrobiia bacterium]
MSEADLRRVRFAPSPTGYLHVGSARTALFNWLYARSVGGTMVLRIEDTDESRNRPELTDAIFEYLEWLGIDYDEGPYYQSERRDRHREAVQQLLDDGRAYLCDVDDNELAGTEMADGRAVRFRTPEGTTVIDDVVRGEVAVDHAQLGDFVIWRSDGSPTFVLANAVDDADMAITHAIRGEDLLSSTPRAVLVAQALGATPPIYAHLPLLVNEQRKKLSKRRDDVSLESYRQRGFLASAMANYLALLGWGPRDGVEIRPMAEIIEQFRLEDVNKAPAFFDIAKLEHFNGMYIRELGPEELLEALAPYLESDQVPWPPESYRPDVVAAMVPLVQEKLRTLDGIVRQVDWLFCPEVSIDEASWDKAMVRGKASIEILDGAIAALADCPWDPDTVKDAVFAVGEAHGVNRSKSQAPVRVAVTGRSVGPPLFEPMVHHLTREEVLRRLQAARSCF